MGHGSIEEGLEEGAKGEQVLERQRLHDGRTGTAEAADILVSEMQIGLSLAICERHERLRWLHWSGIAGHGLMHKSRTGIG